MEQPLTLQRKATEALVHLLPQSLGTLASGGLVSSVSGSLLPLSLQLATENKYLTLLNICHQSKRLQQWLHALLHCLN